MQCSGKEGTLNRQDKTGGDGLTSSEDPGSRIMRRCVSVWSGMDLVWMVRLWMVVVSGERSRVELMKLHLRYRDHHKEPRSCHRAAAAGRNTSYSVFQYISRRFNWTVSIISLFPFFSSS